MRLLLLAPLGALILACGGDDSKSAAPARTDGGTGISAPDGGPVVPTAGCGAAPAVTGFLGQQTSNGRTYGLYLPTEYDRNTAYPVILVFHGDGGTGSGIRGSYTIEDASGGKAIIAYPDGTGNTWNIDDYAGMKKDIDFTDALIGRLQSTYCTDKAHVMVAGFSKGAYFVNQYACRTAIPITAVVSNSGGGPFGTGGSDTFDGNGDLVCPAPATAALQVQGDQDGTVDPTEGMKARDFWIAKNACKKTTKPSAPAPCVSYDGCQHPEVWCEIPTLAHQIWTSTASASWAFLKNQ